jgi:hypothetical protein
MRSPKEIDLDKRILKLLHGKARQAAELLIKDKEIHYLQEYANTVSIRRLHYNDHGPVHMRTVTVNALTMLDLLHRAGVELNLEQEEAGTVDDSRIAVLLSAFLHDVGMTVGRERHERNGAILAYPLMDRILGQVYPDDLGKRVIVRTMALEGVVGHMATQRIHSLEAGLILVADGCDMQKGRARIPMKMATDPMVGDIHKYSASAIETVSIEPGQQHPIRITVTMTGAVGFFQIEEVLFAKVKISPVKPYIELYAGIIGEEMKCYL